MHNLTSMVTLQCFSCSFLPYTIFLHLFIYSLYSYEAHKLSEVHMIGKEKYVSI